MKNKLKIVFASVGRFFGWLANRWSQCGLYLYLLTTANLIGRVYLVEQHYLAAVICVVALPLLLAVVFPWLVLLLLNSDRIFEVTKKAIINAYILVETLISISLVALFPKVSGYMAPIILIWYVAMVNFSSWLNDTHNAYEIKWLKKIYQVIPHISAFLLFILPIIGILYIVATLESVITTKIFLATIMIISSVCIYANDGALIEKIIFYDESNQKKRYF